MMGAKKAVGPLSERPARASSPPGASEKRMKAAPKWSPTLPSARASVVPDPLAEAHAALAEARAALDVVLLCLDRISSRRKER